MKCDQLLGERMWLKVQGPGISAFNVLPLFLGHGLAKLGTPLCAPGQHLFSASATPEQLSILT